MPFRIVLRSVLAIVALACSSATHAQFLFRAYLSSDGLDTNPCTLAQPCRLLPAALTVVVSGGEIWMLDSANYNGATVNVNKSVTILAVPGAVGSVVATGGPAIRIDTPDVAVALRNLLIVPALTLAAATDGVQMTNGSRLTIEDCLIANLPGDGVNVNTAAKVRIVNSIIRDNLNGLVFAGLAAATVSGVKVLGSGHTGIRGTANVPGLTSVEVSDSVVSAGALGVGATVGVANAVMNFTLSRSTISNNSASGISVAAALGPLTMVVGGNTISNNTQFGMVQSGATATLASMGNNIVQSNGNGPTAGTITPITGF